jgi:hypothetical protein
VPDAAPHDEDGSAGLLDQPPGHASEHGRQDAPEAPRSAPEQIHAGAHLDEHRPGLSGEPVHLDRDAEGPRAARVGLKVLLTGLAAHREELQTRTGERSQADCIAQRESSAGVTRSCGVPACTS